MRSMEEARGIHEWCERACTFGRFRGAKRYVPYLWGIANMEESEDCVEWDGSIQVTITPEDTFIFPELKGKSIVILKQDFATAIVNEVPAAKTSETCERCWVTPYEAVSQCPHASTDCIQGCKVKGVGA